MSLNKFTNISEEHKWMNINCNNLSLGTGQLKTQGYSPVLQISVGTITSNSGFYYTCDNTSLRIRGTVNYASPVTPNNNFTMDIPLPVELQEKFAVGGEILVSGNLSEYPFNLNGNRGQVVAGVYNNIGGITTTVFYNANQTTVVSFKVSFDILIYKL